MPEEEKTAPTDLDQKEMMKLIKENAELLKENNELLRKIHKQHIYGVVFKFVWFAVIIGLPFAIYFYVLEPYFDALGANYEVFRDGLSEIPGLKGLEQLLPKVD